MSSICTSFLAVTLALGAGGEQGFLEAKPVITPGEHKAVPDIWAFDFIFRNPRYIEIDVPGKGRQLIWYMTYKIVNRTGAPRVFVPEFTLVTNKGRVYSDVILPRAEKGVIEREQPERLFNSVTVSADPIPPTPEEGAPIVRRGVVFWEDVDMSAREFTIYVAGLSNGYTRVVDPNTHEETLRRKTLELKFEKPGDIYNPNEKEIRLLDNPNWIYR